MTIYSEKRDLSSGDPSFVYTRDYYPYSGPSSTLSVTSYGATGDGVTDDAQAVQDTMDAAVAGDTVFFPAGTYLLDAFFVAIKSGVRVRGAGMGSTRLLRGDTLTTQPIFRVSTHVKDNEAGHTGYAGDKDNIEICHMTLDFNSTPSGWVVGSTLIYIIQFHQCDN